MERVKGEVIQNRYRSYTLTWDVALHTLNVMILKELQT